MSQTFEQLKHAVSDLPISERAELAEYLLRSLDGEPKDLEAWLDLAADRMADVKAGKVVGVSAEEVLRNLPGSRK